MHIKGVHNIKTHITLARSAATDWHNVRSRVNYNSSSESSSWSADQHTYKRPPKARRSVFSDLYLDERVTMHLIQVTQEVLQEMEKAMAEGIPVAIKELERLRVKLSKLKTE